MGRQHTAVTVQQRDGSIPDLTVLGPACHLQMCFDEMRHGATDAAMTVSSEDRRGC